MRFSMLIAAMLALFISASPAMADDDVSFLKTGLQMGTTLCGDAGSYQCSSLSTSSSTLIDAANQCINTYHGITDKIMADFRTSGEYENCVLPNKMFVDATNTNNWSVCCVRRLRPGEECSLVCTRFISNKAQPKP